MGGPQRITGWHQEITRLQLRMKMRQILTGPECDKIDFTLGNAGVSRFTFRNVATGLMQIEQGKPEFDTIQKVYKQKVSVRFNVRAGNAELIEQNGKLYATKAEYDSGSNTFMFPWEDPNGQLDREATIVHESVHAGLDFDAKPVGRLDDEASARIAAEMYKLLKTQRKYSADSKSMDLVFQRAAEVVLDSGKCYIFPETHRRIMHEVLMDGGYRFTRTDMANADGAAPNVWWLTVNPVGKP
jgi:hypothetical protein